MATSVPDSCSPLPPKAPNRPLFERTVQELSVEIAALEERRRFLLERLKLLKEQLNSCRDERDKIGEERTHVDERLNQINREVDAKRDQVQKLRAGLPYLSEDHIQDQVKNLEYQLRKHNFKPAEEKKIIIEIDRLNRSKKALKEHNLLKVRRYSCFAAVDMRRFVK